MECWNIYILEGNNETSLFSQSLVQSQQLDHSYPGAFGTFISWRQTSLFLITIFCVCSNSYSLVQLFISWSWNTHILEGSTVLSLKPKIKNTRSTALPIFVVKIKKHLSATLWTRMVSKFKMGKMQRSACWQEQQSFRGRAQFNVGDPPPPDSHSYAKSRC